jgi:hypothetical protein
MAEFGGGVKGRIGDPNDKFGCAGVEEFGGAAKDRIGGPVGFGGPNDRFGCAGVEEFGGGVKGRIGGPNETPVCGGPAGFGAGMTEVNAWSGRAAFA